MTDDVVALLDKWIAALKGHPAAWAGISYEEVQRIHDEIAALRKLTDGGWVWKQITNVRDEALEEAARIAENECVVPPDAEEEQEMCYHIAAAIRALKGRKTP